MKNKKPNDQIAQDYQIKKRVFLSQLKNAPYSDTLISNWMKTFEDENNVKEYLKGINHNNKEWARLRGQYTKEQFVEMLYNDYEQQGLPHGLIVPLMICSCPSIKDTFLAMEFAKSVKVYYCNGMRVIDMTK